MIGFFDSGYGGKTILNSVASVLPQYDYIYLGDNYRAPYGNYPPEVIQELTEKAINYLFDQGAILIVIACNTATTVALRYLQEKYLRNPNIMDKKILGIVLPTLEEVVSLGHKNIGLIGTRATINSKAYETELQKINPEITVHSKACPLLVPFIEENWHHTPECKTVLKKYLRPLKSHNIESLILGCTHYPLIEKEIKKIMGPKINIINQGPIVAQSLISYLDRHPEIESLLSKNGNQRYLTTGCPKKFEQFISSFGKSKITTIEKVSF